ncbi:hypothetical protein FQA39_LY03108 [Lamprigera yunnana]|nr:hypothetical protein FQA39_LY03108 [Lamprigera yunnana]
MSAKTDSRGNHYHYTKNGLYLTEEQRKFYEENGYLIVRKLMDPKILDACRERFLDFCNNEKSDVKVKQYMIDTYMKRQNAQGENLIHAVLDLLSDEIFFQSVLYKPLVDIVESIVGRNITVCSTLLVNKSPNTVRDYSFRPLHQDLYYFPFRPANSLVASWTAMQAIDEKNGCLFVVPGSHKGTLLNHDYPKDVKHRVYEKVLGLDEIPTVNLVLEKGDTIFFHPLLLHGSRQNTTKNFRKTIYCHYADSDCHFIDVKGTLQEPVVKILLHGAEKNGMGKITINKFFNAKSQVIRGRPGRFQDMESHL